MPDISCAFLIKPLLFFSRMFFPSFAVHHHHTFRGVSRWGYVLFLSSRLLSHGGAGIFILCHLATSGSLSTFAERISERWLLLGGRNVLTVQILSTYPHFPLDSSVTLWQKPRLVLCIRLHQLSLCCWGSAAVPSSRSAPCCGVVCPQTLAQLLSLPLSHRPSRSLFRGLSWSPSDPLLPAPVPHPAPFLRSADCWREPVGAHLSRVSPAVSHPSRQRTQLPVHSRFPFTETVSDTAAAAQILE